MIPAILIGRQHSKGFPGKNVTPLLGHPLFTYPMRAAAAVKDIDLIVVSSDDKSIQEYIVKATRPPYRGTPIKYLERPHWLCTDEALGGDVYQYVYKELTIQDTSTRQLELVVLMMCNAPMVTPQILQEGIDALRANPTLDSAITVSSYNMWNPSRARREDAEGLLQPMVTLDGATCDRNSVGETWFADFGAVIVRPHCLDTLDGLPPQPWMGNRIYPLKQWGGLDVDFAWQLPQVEYWLRAHGALPEW